MMNDPKDQAPEVDEPIDMVLECQLIRERAERVRRWLYTNRTFVKVDALLPESSSAAVVNRTEEFPTK